MGSILPHLMRRVALVLSLWQKERRPLFLCFSHILRSSQPKNNQGCAVNTLNKIIQSDRLKDQLAGAQKTADFGGKLARIVDFVLPGSGLVLNVATALVSGAAQAALAASGKVNGSSELFDRDAYAGIYTATLHEAYLRAMVDVLDENDLGSVEAASVEDGLPSLADTAAELAYNRAQFGSFRQDQLFLLYERYLAQFLRLPQGKPEAMSGHEKLEAVRQAAIHNFDTSISKDGAGNWVFRLELRQDVRDVKELGHQILSEATHIKESVQRLAEAANNASFKAGQEPTKNDRNTLEKNQVSNSRNFIIGDNATLIVNQSDALGKPGTKLTSALSLIEQMPTDAIPDIASIPSHSRFDFESNPAFVGREDELIKMAKALKAGGALAVVPKLVTTGMGGIGKSQVAVEFVHRYGQFFAGGVYWMNMEAADLVPVEVLACGDAMGLTAILKELPEEKRIARVQKEWREAIPRLLIFDNCEDVHLYKKWVPISGGSRVLVTSRMQAWARKGPLPCLPIATLPREKSLALLFGLAPRLKEDKDVANAIAEFLGDLPLALHLAGNYLATFSMTQPAEYLEELDTADTGDFHPSLEGEDADGSPTKHDLSVGWTFAVSYLKLEEADPVDAIAIRILGCAVWFAHGVPIPKWLLLRCVEKEGVDGMSLQRGLNRLLELGLLQSTTSADTVQIHRLIAAFAKYQMQDPFVWEWVVNTLNQEAIKVNNSGDPRGLTTWVRHLIEITDQAIHEHEQSAALLASHLGCWLEMDGQYQRALPYYEQALAIDQKVFGEAHPDTATCFNNLGGLLHAMGDLKGARPYYAQALAIRRKMLGEIHPDTANSLNDLGVLLQAMGDLKGAVPYYKQALAINEKVLGERHPGTATILNNLGYLSQEIKDLKGAQSYYQQALAIRRKVLGEAHPDTATSLNNMGYLLQATGDLKEARPYYEQALAICRQMLGETHPDTACSLNNLGYLLHTMGDLKGAQPYYEQALAICQKVLGGVHLDTAGSLGNLGALLYEMGDRKGALQYCAQALAIRRQVLGEAHPDNSDSFHN